MDATIPEDYRNVVDPGRFKQVWRAATLYSKSEMVPKRFQARFAEPGQDRISDCFVVIDTAMRLKINIMLAFQQLYVVHGTPSMGAQLAIALANRSEAIDGRIHFELTGEGGTRACRAYATDDTGTKIDLTVDMALANKSGWTKPRGKSGMIPLWVTNPDLMLRYRSATYLIRTHCPEVQMGLPTDDEVEDMDEPKAIPATPKSLGELTERLNAPAVDVESEPEDILTPKGQAVAAEAPADETLKAANKPDPVIWMAELEEAFGAAKTTEEVMALCDQGKAFIKELGGSQKTYAGNVETWDKKAHHRIADKDI